MEHVVFVGFVVETFSKLPWVRTYWVKGDSEYALDSRYKQRERLVSVTCTYCLTSIRLVIKAMITAAGLRSHFFRKNGNVTIAQI